MIDFRAARTMMVDCQVRPSDVTRYPIIQAMLEIPREVFVPSEMKPVAYAGAHVDLGGGRVVLDPRTFGKMVDTLEVAPGDLILDIGCGLGYSAAVLARLGEAVIALEDDADRVAEASTLLAEQSADNAVVTEAVLAEGDPAHGPYDVIIIEGGIETLPAAIADQLKEGGRIAAIFMNGALGQMRLGLKTGGRIAWRHVFDATAPVLPGFVSPKEFSF